MDPYGEPPELSTISDIFGNILTSLIPLIGIAAFIMLLFGGFTVLTSSGNPEGMEKGKKIITFAIVGVALSIVSWLTLLLIETITGAPVTEFKFSF